MPSYIISLVEHRTQVEYNVIMSAFTGLSEELLEHILRDAPEYLLGTLADVLRALFYHMNLPENEVGAQSPR